MNDVSSTRQLRDRGLSGNEVAQLLAAGELTRVRRGGYADAAAEAPEDRHRQLLSTSLPLLHPDAVLSHGSAAVLHGLPVPSRSLDRVHVTRNRPNGQRLGAWVQVHGSPLDPTEVVLAYGWPTTSTSRTVVDVGRTLPLPWGGGRRGPGTGRRGRPGRSRGGRTAGPWLARDPAGAAGRGLRRPTRRERR